MGFLEIVVWLVHFKMVNWRALEEIADFEVNVRFIWKANAVQEKYDVGPSC